jgi:hypothetical protein
MTLAPDLYKWSTGVITLTDIILPGGANDIWILQIVRTLIVSNGVYVNLHGGVPSQQHFLAKSLAKQPLERRL